MGRRTQPLQTAFTVSIEASEGVTTGARRGQGPDIKAAWRGGPARGSARPGHVFPLCARPGGVLERRGHTEATVDLMRLAGLPPYGVLCELTNPDGTMARLPEILRFGAEHGLPVVTVEDLAAWREESPGGTSRR